MCSWDSGIMTVLNDQSACRSWCPFQIMKQGIVLPTLGTVLTGTQGSEMGTRINKWIIYFDSVIMSETQIHIEYQFTFNRILINKIEKMRTENSLINRSNRS